MRPGGHSEKRRILVLISGGGTNLQALIDATRDDEFPGSIVAVISNKPEAGGLARARHAGIPTETLDHRQYPDRTSFDQALKARIDAHQPDLVVLAGFMRILTSDFVRHYHGRLVNIHPSLLPHYPGLHTHRQALAAGDAEHGATVHFVTEELDGGPGILQTRVPILPNDTETSLAARVLAEEHRIYPDVVRWFCEGRLVLGENAVVFDGQPLAQPLQRAVGEH
ncbi:phosphoribosylglycinamide formyltransferase [Mangrovitalea sediminis]|uniref:phosphoribosylglycinamide formyltransferase n=1 Tax=Mangrovitalea sediminis TaxID=1982043 RepID=UPI000BE4D7C5|nr:phosphoribosylglycinamide formyltransferase [Mangrovitalea sediminis]